MGRFSILSRKARVEAEPIPVLTEEPEAVVRDAPRETLRFPGSDTEMSVAEMAQSDLEAALQLLAERAQYITGASGAAIALRNGEEIICRASAGASAPEVGAHLQINSGLSGESIRTRAILRCDDAETDTRVNRESCRALGIASVVVLPLLRDNEVNGVFELFSGRANAFEERDIAALQRLAEMIQTAIQHNDASRVAEQEYTADADDVLVIDDSDEALPAQPENLQAESLENETILVVEADPEPKAEVQDVEEVVEAQPAVARVAPIAAEGAIAPIEPAQESEAAVMAAPVSTEEPVMTERGNFRTCQSCGFPISESRTLCLDCEGTQGATSEDSFLSQYQSEESWIASHKYLIGIAVVVVATIIVLINFR